MTNFEEATIAAQIADRFNSDLLDEETCRRFLLPIIRTAMVCAGCGAAFSGAETERTLAGRDVICGCGRKSSPRSGTALDGVHAGYREVLLVAIMLHWGVKRQEIARRSGISDDSVRRLQARLGA